MLIILLINAVGLDLSYAVLAGTALALALGWKDLPTKLRTLNEGISKVGPAIIITAASVDFGGVVLAFPTMECLSPFRTPVASTQGSATVTSSYPPC